ncbi:MAG: SDR family oxidoreductase [Chloroherpetonaceae bacterium]|nr:SDR family oxidoreductase [Chloroherpetonaceae bacterium]
MYLRGKTALITGGGSGIGLAIAESLASEGVQTILASRRLEVLESAARMISKKYGTPSHALPLDLRDTRSIRSATDSVLQKFGKVEILINNSGLGVDASAVEMTEDQWDLVMDTNVKGTFLLTQALLPKMIEARLGHIINISSQAGRNGYARATVYCASKFALIGFGKALQEEVREFNIKVSNLLPALVQVPPPKNDSEVRQGVLQTEDLAQAALYLLRQPDRVKLDDLGLWHI